MSTLVHTCAAAALHAARGPWLSCMKIVVLPGCVNALIAKSGHTPLYKLVLTLFTIEIKHDQVVLDSAWKEVEHEALASDTAQAHRLSPENMEFLIMEMSSMKNALA